MRLKLRTRRGNLLRKLTLTRLEKPKETQAKLFGALSFSHLVQWRSIEDKINLKHQDKPKGK